MRFEKQESGFEIAVKKFWGRLTEMITGPEHEQVYFKKLINRIKTEGKVTKLNKKSIKKSKIVLGGDKMPSKLFALI